MFSIQLPKLGQGHYSTSTRHKSRTDLPAHPCLLSARLCGHSGGSTQAADIKPLLQLRHHMGHLIGNLQIYLQLDVVESNFAQLQAKVAQAQVCMFV